MAGRLQDKGAHHTERLPYLARDAYVAHPVGVKGGRGFTGQSPVLLPLPEQRGCLAVMPVWQFHARRR